MEQEKYPFAKIGSGIGFTIALIYAFQTKSGFWKGFGYTILGSMALGGIGTGVDYLVKKPTNSDPNKGRELDKDEYTGDISFR